LQQVHKVFGLVDSLEVQITSKNAPIGFTDLIVEYFSVLDHFSPLAFTKFPD
jgi:hypothetical protein